MQVAVGLIMLGVVFMVAVIGLNDLVGSVEEQNPWEEIIGFDYGMGKGGKGTLLTFNDTYIMADIFVATSRPTDHEIQIRYNISEVPADVNIDDAQACFYAYQVLGFPDNDTNASRVDNQTWTEAITVAQYNALPLTNTTSSLEWNSTADDTWTCLNVTDFVATDVAHGNDFTTFRIEDLDYIVPSAILKTDTIYLSVGHAEFLGNVFLRSCSREYTGDATLRPYLTVEYSEAGDTAPPTYSDNSTNSTLAGQSIEHRLKWTDDINLSGYIFGFYNGTSSLSTESSYDLSSWALGIEHLTMNNDSSFWIANYSGYVFHTNETFDDMGDGQDLDSVISGNVDGITSNGTDFWIVSSNELVYHFNSTWDNQSNGFSISGQTSSATGISTNNTHFWIGGGTAGNQHIYLYNSTGDYQGVSNNISQLGIGYFYDFEIDSDGYIWFVEDSGQTYDIIYRVYEDNYIIFNFTIQPIASPSLSGITTLNGDVFWVLDYDREDISYHIVLENDTHVVMTGLANWSNVTKDVDSTVDRNISWKVYANDTSNNWNVSPNYIYTLTSEEDNEAPTYGIGYYNHRMNVTTPRSSGDINFTHNFSDNVSLSGYIFESNFSGSFVNSSWNSFSGSWASNISTLPSANWTYYEYRWHVNDTSDNWNTTPYYHVLSIPQEAYKINITNSYNDWAIENWSVSYNADSEHVYSGGYNISNVLSFMRSYMSFDISDVSGDVINAYLFMFLESNQDDFQNLTTYVLTNDTLNYNYTECNAGSEPENCYNHTGRDQGDLVGTWHELGNHDTNPSGEWYYTNITLDFKTEVDNSEDVYLIWIDSDVNWTNFESTPSSWESWLIFNDYDHAVPPDASPETAFIVFTNVSGVQQYNRSVVVSFTTTDSDIKTYDGVRQASDGLTITAPNTRQAVFPRTLTNSLSLNDNYEKTFNGVRRSAEPISITDSTDKSTIFLRQIANTITFVDDTQTTALKLYSYTLSLSLGFTDANIREANFTRLANQSLTMTDEATTRNDFVRILSQSMTMADSVTFDALKLYSYIITLSVGLTDDTIKQADLVRITDQTVTLTDTIETRSNLVRLLSQSMLINDEAISNALKLYAYIVTATLGVTDSSEKTFDGVRLASEDIPITDTTTKQADLIRSIADSIGISDVVNVSTELVTIYSYLLSLGLGFTDEVTRQADFVRYADQSIVATDTTGIRRDLIRQLTQEFTVNDSALYDALIIYSYLVTASFTISDDEIKQADFKRDSPQIITVNDVAEIDRNLTIRLAQSLGVSEASLVNALELYTRLIVDSFGLDDSAEKHGDFLRSINQSVTFNDEYLLGKDLILRFVQSLSISDSTYANKFIMGLYTRMVSLAIGLTETMSPSGKITPWTPIPEPASRFLCLYQIGDYWFCIEVLT